MRAMVIDDEPERAQLLEVREILHECHISLDSEYEFLGMIGADDFCQRVRALTRPPDLVIIDYSLGWEDSKGDRWDGDKVARFLRQYWQDDVPFYIIFVSQVLRTMSTPYEQLISLLRVPYTGFVEFDSEWKRAFEDHVRCACDRARADKSRAIDALRRQRIDEFFGEDIRGKAPSLLQAGWAALKVSTTKASVLILGESGTGKDLLANAIHDNSPRYNKQFVALNCAAMPETLIESELFGHLRGAFTDARTDRQGLVARAEGGTLFLDEIGEMSPTMQAKVLRLLDKREYLPIGQTKPTIADVRIIAATHQPLQQLVAEGKFREDLYYRLKVVTVELPPLRDRREDIRDLAEYFLERSSAEYAVGTRTFSHEAIRKLGSHSWPGNVRELENAIKHAVLMSEGSIVEAPDLDLSASGQSDSLSTGIFEGTWADASRAFKKAYFESKIQECNGNLTQAAEKAGMSRENVHRLTIELGVHPRMKKGINA